MLEFLRYPKTLSSRRDSRRRNIGFRLSLLLLAATLLFSLQACGKKPRTVPPTTAPGAGSAGGPSSPGAADNTAPVPDLTLRIEPPVISPGESALLTWETHHADRVLIEPSIGAVDPSGRVKFFPERTTTYTVRAEGPGGGVRRSVTVEVRTGASAPNIDEEDVQALPLAEQFEAMVKPVFFDFDSASLSEEAKLTLDANIRWLERPENRLLRVLLEGHCDNRGTEEYNLALGDERASVVRDYLLAHGLDASRIATVSLGEERPFDTRRTEEGFALNRRTQFVLMGEQ